MKSKIIILFVLIIIFAPFFVKAQEAPPEPAPDLANLKITVIATDPEEMFQVRLMACQNERGCDNLNIFDVSVATPVFTTISADNIFYFIVFQEEKPGSKLVGSFCVSDNGVPLDGTTILNPSPNSNIECIFSNEKTKMPVLIVPGLLGTEIKKENELLWADFGRMLIDIGDQFMDPIAFDSNLAQINSNVSSADVIGSKVLGPIKFDYTKGLVDEFTGQGYVENQDLFLFPYDWRYGVSGKYANDQTNADLLAQKIQDILATTGAEKVDVVAHSMGGLIVKKYVKDIMPLQTNSNTINKAVFVGVPNIGAPKAVKVLLSGDNFGIPWLADSEMKKVAENLPASYDLLPTQKYFDASGSFVKTIKQAEITLENLGAQNEIKELNYQETKSYLTVDHALNSLAMTGAENLHTADFDNFDLRTAGVNLYSINGCKKATIGKITETKYNTLLGSFTDFDVQKFSAGDGTVPFASASSLPIDENNKFYALVADHGKMPSQDGIRQQIINILTNNSPFAVQSGSITQDEGQCNLTGKAISIFSPVNISVTDQNGNKLGLAEDQSVLNEIPNADFEIFGEHKFVFLPEDSGQSYTINLTGTGSGTFTIRQENIENGQTIATETFSDLPVTPELTGQIILANSNLKIKQTPTSEEQTILPDSLQPPPSTIEPPVVLALVVSGGANHYLNPLPAPLPLPEPEPVLPPVVVALAPVLAPLSEPIPQPVVKTNETQKTLKPVKLSFNMVGPMPSVFSAGLTAKPDFLSNLKNWFGQVFHKLFKK